MDGITNGGFESGGLDGWNVVQGTSSLDVLPNGALSGSANGPHTGSYYLVVNQGGLVGDNVVEQALQVPATGTTTLTLWYSSFCLQPFDGNRNRIDVTDTSGNVLANVLSACTNSGGAWSQASVSLTPWAGRTVRVRFDAVNGSELDVDDVVVSSQ